jgi:hypothetical protein
VSQPNPFNRSFSFSNFQAANPSLPIPGSQVDLELNNAKSSLDGVLTNLKLIQRDDGALKNSSVTFDTLSPSLQTAGIAPALPWVTSTGYAVSERDTWQRVLSLSDRAHRRRVCHRPGGWQLGAHRGFRDDRPCRGGHDRGDAVGLANHRRPNLAAGAGHRQGAAVSYHTQLSSTISDSTATGRALLVAADATAQNVLLGTTSLGFQSGNIKEPGALFSRQAGITATARTRTASPTSICSTPSPSSRTVLPNSGSPVITGLSDTTNGGNTPMSPGMPLSGSEIPAAAVILSVDSATQVTLSANATLSAATPLVLRPTASAMARAPLGYRTVATSQSAATTPAAPRPMSARFRPRTT